jgi:hypothetical protein
VATGKRKAAPPKKSEADSPLDEISPSLAVEQLARGRLDLVGPFLRDHVAKSLRESGHEELAKLTSVMGDLLDPAGESEQRLKLGWRGRGRPPRTMTACRNEAEINREIEDYRSRHAGSLKAAMAQVGEQRKIGRTKLFGIWKRPSACTASRPK